jgi:hypothetical protein
VPADVPQTFMELKNLVRIHLKQILRLDEITTKVPINAVALLITIAYEALSKFCHPRKGPEFLFAQEYYERHHVPPSIGGDIFNALRNGLAHRYDPYPIAARGVGEIRLELAWKDCAVYHLRGIRIETLKGHQKACRFPKGSTEIPRAFCLNVDSMWRDLDDLLSRYEAGLRGDANLASRFETNMDKNLKTFRREAVGDEARQWRDFLSARRAEDS